MTILIPLTLVGCSFIWEEFIKPTQDEDTAFLLSPTEPSQPVAEPTDPAVEPTAEPTAEPEATEPSEPASQPSEPAAQPVSEPEDTAEETGPCGNNQICDLTITNPELFGCDSTEPQEIVFSNSGIGSLFMYHKSVYDGCCPTFTPTATADLSTSTIQVNYTFTDDICDCVCPGISVRYTLSDIPAGTYQLSALTETVEVVIE
jgi:hypothetical protein